MIKRISLVLVISFSFIQSINAQPVTALQPAIASLSLNANNTAAPQTGTAYAIPQFCNTLTWITSFGSAPASVNTNLETSNDNITYAITDSSVLTTGESRVIFTAARFVRTVETARSGGSAITTSLVCKGGTTNFSVINAPLSVVRDSIAASSTDGLILLNRTNATAGVPVQFSPRLRLRANVWNTTVTAASNASDVWLENVPFSGPFPSGALRLAAQDPSQNSGVGYPLYGRLQLLLYQILFFLGIQ
jgi:hypothetical protein